MFATLWLLFNGWLIKHDGFTSAERLVANTYCIEFLGRVWMHYLLLSHRGHLTSANTITNIYLTWPCADTWGLRKWFNASESPVHSCPAQPLLITLCEELQTGCRHVKFMPPTVQIYTLTCAYMSAWSLCTFVAPVWSTLPEAAGFFPEKNWGETNFFCLPILFSLLPLPPAG